MSECVLDAWLNTDVLVSLQSELSTIFGVSNLAGTVYFYVTKKKITWLDFLLKTRFLKRCFFHVRHRTVLIIQKSFKQFM